MCREDSTLSRYTVGKSEMDHRTPEPQRRGLSGGEISLGFTRRTGHCHGVRRSAIPFVSALPFLMLFPEGHSYGQTNRRVETEASPYFTLQPRAGDTLYYIGFRTIVLSAPGLDHSNVSPSGSDANFKILPGSTADDLKMTTSARIEGEFQVENAPYELRDHGDTECFQGKCYPEHSATAMVAKATVWGVPAGPLHAGMSWTTYISYPWEFGPPGKQTIRVVSVDPGDGTVVLTRDGAGDGPRDRAGSTTTVTRDKKSFTVSVRRGHTHWSGQATIRHGLIVSDECLSDAVVELSSPEFGTVTGRERMFMAIMQHPEAFDY
jgi:hypothetical protein